MKHLNSPDRKALSTLNNNVSNIPLSPTANLKLLTKVASELVSPVRSFKPTSKKALSKEPSDSKTRKDKSLGILCDRFLAMFPLNLPGNQVLEICLDQVSEQLGIVKRRIYDIINILESLQMASKVAKNCYHWHGCRNLQLTLSQLKTMALKWGIDQKLQEIQQLQRGGFRLVSGPTCCCFRDTIGSHLTDDISTVIEGDGESASRSRDGFFSDERTLGVMCLKFIMLFLASPQLSARVNLDLATRMLISEAAEGDLERNQWGMKVECHRRPGDEACEVGSKSCRCMLRLKTKVRRLYDIANVLTSLGLIEKIETTNNSMRKPVFVYTGPDVDKEDTVSEPTNQLLSFKNFLSGAVSEEEEGIENKSKPASLKRKDSKLKGGPSEKFSRMSSEQSLGVDNRRCASSQNLSARHVSSVTSVPPKSNHSFYQCSLDDIMQVAGQELEKIKSSEELVAAQKESSVRKKLSFARFHSDSCLQPSVVHESLLTAQSAKETFSLSEKCSADPEVPVLSPKKSVCITLSASKNKRFTITRKLVEVPSHALPRKLVEEPSLKVHNVTPMQAQTLSTLFGIPHGQNQGHVLKGDSTNSMKLFTSTDVKNNNNPPVQNFVVKSSEKAGVGSSRNFAPSAISGELYRAIKVGNLVRLVPLITTGGANPK